MINALTAITVHTTLALMVMGNLTFGVMTPPPPTIQPRVMKPQHNKLLQAIHIQEAKHDSDPNPVGNASEFGPFQIRLSTMRYQLKWKGTNKELINILWTHLKAKWIADAILHSCSRKYGFKTQKEKLYCYNAGPHSTFGKGPKVMKYVREVTLIYGRIKDGN